MPVSSSAVCYKPDCESGNPTKIGMSVLKKATPAKPMLFKNVDDCMEGHVNIKAVFGNPK
eukprot:gene10201-25215_t